MKGPGRYSRKSSKTKLEARTDAFEQSLKLKTKQVGGFHKPGSNK
jgi:hypothetical protein